jgi:hypothetical protein
MSPKTKLVLPFELSKSSRQEAFKNRLEQYAFKIDKISYQLINGYNKSEDKNGSSFDCFFKNHSIVHINK